MNIAKAQEVFHCHVKQVQNAKVDNTPKLSVVLPVYQEDDTLSEVVTQLVQVLGAIGTTFEIILIDDDSDDGTDDAMKNLQVEYPHYLAIKTHPYNKGKGAAIKTGIRAARGEIIVCMDAGGQHAPREIYQLLPYMAEYDLVIGARTQSFQSNWYRNLAHKFYNGLASWLTEFPVEDLTSRLFSASVVKKYIQLFPARFSYPTTSKV